MRTAVGIFTTRSAAEAAAEQLRAMGFLAEHIATLTPDRPDLRAAMPAAHGEPPGMGKAVGSVVGTAVGMSTGVAAGAAVATFFVPGVGPIIATGLLGGALLGLGGAALGGAVETAMTQGVPKDEVFVYEDALRQGRSVVVAMADDQAQVDGARAVLGQAGAETVDAARDQWWIGLRSAEREHYITTGRPFDPDEPMFRQGFEAAQMLGLRGKTFGEAQAELRERYPDIYEQEPFRRGYERGLAYYRGLEDLRGREAA